MQVHEFDLEVEYIRGKTSMMADAFSQYPTKDPVETDLAEERDTLRTLRAICTPCIVKADVPIHLQSVREVADHDNEYQTLKETILHQ